MILDARIESEFPDSVQIDDAAASSRPALDRSVTGPVGEMEFRGRSGCNQALLVDGPLAFSFSARMRR